MSQQTVVESHYKVNGTKVTVKLINNPTIEDVLVTEARLSAYEYDQGPISDRKNVSRSIRDFLIRLGVER